MVRPALLKGVPTAREFDQAKQGKKPLFLGIPLATGKTGRACQLKCTYCFVSKKPPSDELTLKEHLGIMDQFVEMGGRYVKTAHNGEPFMDRSFFSPKRDNPFGLRYPLIAHANTRGLYWSSFSNLLAVTPEMAKELYSMSVSFTGKLNSLNPEVQERLSGSTGLFRKEEWREHNGVMVPKGLKHLIDAGFNRTFEEDGTVYTRLGVDIIVTSLNYKEIPEIVRFCLENDIYPDVESLEMSGDVRRNEYLFLTDEQNRWLYAELASLLGPRFLEEDRDMVTNFCSVYHTGIVYESDGSLKFCYVVPGCSEFNVRRDRLMDIYPRLLELKEARYVELMGAGSAKLTMLSPCLNTTVERCDYDHVD
jgi:MoaA/NifB/PqqE/SkfB family radical SAM enzyme